ncbi:hypothetical protein AB0M68_19485 [Streptomyces sp. NPDC051453]|uniref:hypothetical protein n=1 Tax=Streptomyces sp. NPDC051453 TaxID=3154941 RepID=UPI00344790AA
MNPSAATGLRRHAGPGPAGSNPASGNRSPAGHMVLLPALVLLTAGLGAPVAAAHTASISPNAASRSFHTTRAAQAVISVPCNEGALVNAINTANSTPTTPDTLNLAPRCIYILTTNHGSGVDGLPGITSPITINGRGATITRASSAPEFRILFVAPNGGLTLNKTTISNGKTGAGGGGIQNNGGTLAVRDSTIRNNTAEFGGGIDNRGTLTVRDTTIRNNTASNTINSGRGGGIFDSTLSPVTVTASIIRNNTADEAGGGIYHNFGTIALTSSTIDHNTASRGGGFWNSGGSTASVRASAIRNNTANSNGGAVFNNGGTINFRLSAVQHNTAVGDGGGIYNNTGTVTPLRSTIRNNTPNNCAGTPVPGCSG